MLRLVHRRSTPSRVLVIATVPADIDKTIRNAFGRYRLSDAQAAGSHSLRELCSSFGDFWLLCDCYGDHSTQAPLLVPVESRFIRRHVQNDWPEHAALCDFYRDPEEQSLIVRSYDRPKNNVVATIFRQHPPKLAPRGNSIKENKSNTRPALAALLCEMALRAGWQKFRGCTHIGEIGDQYKSLKRAAATFDYGDFDGGRPPGLLTYMPAVEELLSRRQLDPDFTRPRLIAGLASSCKPPIVRFKDSAIHVEGAFSVYDDTAGLETSVTHDESPYFFIGTAVFDPSKRRYAVTAAYAHPVVSARRLMIIDNGFERETIRQIETVCTWVGAKGVSVEVEKPLFNLPSAHTFSADRFLLPDFVVTGTKEDRATKVCVESMAYDDAGNRSLKWQLQSQITDVLGFPVVTHDAFRPERFTQTQRDSFFCKALYGRIMSGLDQPRGKTVPSDS